MTNAELAILSLIAEQPRHGYEIEQIIQERGMRQWTEVGFSSIYYVLNKLEKKGYLRSQAGQQRGRGPAPRVYRLTRAGGRAWQEAVVAALSEPRPCYTPLQLGMANMVFLEPERVLRALRLYRQRLREQIDRVKQQARRQRPLPDHVETMFDYSLTMMGAEANWLSRLIKRMEQDDVKN